MFTMIIGTTIAALRKEQNMTQEALANALGVTNQAVSKWESDQSCPDISLLPSIAELFHVSIDSLFGRETIPASTLPSLPWADDDTLRIVVFRGHSYLENHDSASHIHIRLTGSNMQNVECAASLTVEGNVYGNANSAGSLSCGDVYGDATAGGNVNCDNVQCDVRAGGSVTCDNVGCNVQAGCNVTCDSVGGNVTGSGKISLG